MANQRFGSLYPIDFSVVERQRGQKAAAQQIKFSLFPVGGLHSMFLLVKKIANSDQLK